MIAGANEQQRKLCCEDPLQGAVAADILAIKQAVDGGQELSSVPTLLPLSHYVDTGVLRQLFTMQMAGGAPSASELSEGTTADVLAGPGHTGAAAAAGPVTVGADTGAGPSDAGVGGGDAAAAAGPQPAHALLPPLPQEAAGGGSLPAVWPLQPPAGPPPLLHGCLPLPRPGQLLPQLQPGAEMGLPGLATLPQPPLGAMPATPRQPLMPHMIPLPTQQPQQPYQPQPGSSPAGPNAPGAPPTPPKQNPRIITGPDPERFYCPHPGCNRSFTELWRLKVHYRAPPEARGSGVERGHGSELQWCPRCGKDLKPGKHHTGCSAGMTAPRQAAKRQRLQAAGAEQARNVRARANAQAAAAAAANQAAAAAAANQAAAAAGAQAAAALAAPKWP